jgi:hypothetical protein
LLGEILWWFGAVEDEELSVRKIVKGLRREIEFFGPNFGRSTGEHFGYEKRLEC